jgi:hypothetical protein
MVFADVAIWSVHPTSTGRLMAFKFSQLHLCCFFFFIFSFQPLESLLSESVFQKPQIRLALLVVLLMRLMRKGSVIAFPKWVSFKEEVAHLRAPPNIPQLLESIDCLIKKIPQQKQGYYYMLKPCFGFLSSGLRPAYLHWRLKTQPNECGIHLVPHFDECSPDIMLRL